MPTASDSTLVNNGGAAVADRSSATFVSDPVTNDLSIGLRTSPALLSKDSTGTVNLIDVDLSTSGHLDVGAVDTAAAIGDGSWQVSPDAFGPVWAPEGRELFFLSRTSGQQVEGQSLVAVPIEDIR